jgi:hypothetical protein
LRFAASAHSSLRAWGNESPLVAGVAWGGEKMRNLAWLGAAALAAMATSAAAEVKVVPTVLSGSAAWSTTPNTIVLNAVVQLNDSCWSKPRFRPPLANVKQAGDTAPVEIVADYAAGKMCAQVIRTVPVPSYKWRIYPNPALKSVKYVGSTTPVTVQISRR